MTDQLSGAADTAATELSLRDELAAQFEKMSSEPTKDAPVTEHVDDTNQPEPTGSDRARDELGRFATKPAQESGAATVPGKETEQPTIATTEAAKPEGEGAKYAGPPPGWSVASKAAFDALPDAVKADIAKREQEIDKGFAKLREFKDIERALEPHQQMARQYGVDLPEMLSRYHNAETFLQRDPVNALKWLCESYRIDPRQLAGQAVPTTQGQQQGQQYAGATDPALQPLLDQIASLTQQVGRVKSIEETLYADKFNNTLSQVERFGADPKNKYFENVADQMVTLIKQANASGQPVDLASIYETACYMNPEVRQALINERLTTEQRAAADKAKAAANQARNAGSSISGGTAVTQATTEPDSENLRALLEHNFAAQMGRT